MLRALMVMSVMGCLLFSTNSTAQSPKPLSLSDAIQIGLGNNFQIDIAEQSLLIAKNNNNLQEAGQYPIVTLNASQNSSFANINDPTRPFLTGGVFSTGITPSVNANWTLFDGFKVRINKERLEQLEAQSSGNVQLVVENVIQAIISAYYQALIEQEKIKVFREVLQLSKDKLDFENLKRDIGTGSTFDVLQVKNAYLTDSTNITLQRNTLKLALQNLSFVMGEKTPVSYQLTEELDYEAQEYTFDVLQQRMLADNQNLKNQYINLKLQKVNTNFLESNLSPRITTNMGISNNTNYASIGEQSASGNTFSTALGFSLSYNLFDAGRTKRAIENAKIQERVVGLNIQDLELQLTNQLRNILTTYGSQVDLLALNEARIEITRQSLSIAEDRFQAGLINSFNYRDIQVAFLQASMVRLETILGLKGTELQLVRLIGGLSKSGQ
ncbi:MAG: TolC family protein [Chitinophagales bacterium]